jgi:hypothetical protein
VFVARQRDLKEFFPDLVDESKIHEHLDHHSKRFEVTKLQDVELRHIVRGRVLRPRRGRGACRVSALAERHQKVLPALLAGGDLDYLRDVYPFHPALIEMLVDVTVAHAARALGAAAALRAARLPLPGPAARRVPPGGLGLRRHLPRVGVEASKKVELMQDIHHQYYSAPRAGDGRRWPRKVNPSFNPSAAALDQLVKTVLLAEVSPRLKQGGLTIERLVQLNSADVEGETFRGQVRVAETDLLALSQRGARPPGAGQGKTALVRYVLGRVSLGEILAARARRSTTRQRFKVFWGALKLALGSRALKGFEEGGPNEGDWDLTWRRTRRRGRSSSGNVREMSYDDFDPPEGAFKILVDYPWDEPGHTSTRTACAPRTSARSRASCLHGVLAAAPHEPRGARRADRARRGPLPALRGRPGGPARDARPPGPRSKVRRPGGIRAEDPRRPARRAAQRGLHPPRRVLRADLRRRRQPAPETLAENLEHIAALLMDRRYPQHPNFGAEPKKAGPRGPPRLDGEAGETNVSVAYDENVGKVLRNLGQPLELVNLGPDQGVAAPRLALHQGRAPAHRSGLGGVDADRRVTCARPTASSRSVIDLFLCFLCQRDHRALKEVNGEPIEVASACRRRSGCDCSAASW